MKITIALILVISLFSCSKKEHSCQDLKMKKNHSGVCQDNCPGVVGCDGLTYCNECDAARNGIVVN